MRSDAVEIDVRTAVFHPLCCDVIFVHQRTSTVIFQLYAQAAAAMILSIQLDNGRQFIGRCNHSGSKEG